MHVRPPHHLTVAFVALSVVYASAIAVALANPGWPTLAGLVVLAGLAARWVAHHRRYSAPVTVAVPPAAVAVRAPDAAPARATAA